MANRGLPYEPLLKAHFASFATLADMRDLVHTLTRLHSVPELARDPSLPEHERVRGAALAKRLSVPILGRAWQILLKGVAEVNDAPDRRVYVGQRRIVVQ